MAPHRTRVQKLLAQGAAGGAEGDVRLAGLHEGGEVGLRQRRLHPQRLARLVLGHLDERAGNVTPRPHGGWAQNIRCRVGLAVSVGTVLNCGGGAMRDDK